MYSREFDTGNPNGGWSQGSTYHYKPDEHPLEIEFTFEEIHNLFMRVVRQEHLILLIYKKIWVMVEQKNFMVFIFMF